MMAVKPVIADFTDLGSCEATSKLYTSEPCEDRLTIHHIGTSLLHGS
jgi:hypothetical protein